jgi:hypothetical protein
MLHKFRIALAATILALAAVSAVDSASATDDAPMHESGGWWHGFTYRPWEPAAADPRDAGRHTGRAESARASWGARDCQAVWCGSVETVQRISRPEH